MPMFKYITMLSYFWTSNFSPIPRTLMKFSINIFAAMLNMVQQIKSSLKRNPSFELLDITYDPYTYTYLLTGRISKLGLHSLKSYTCVSITSWITLVLVLHFTLVIHIFYPLNLNLLFVILNEVSRIFI